MFDTPLNERPARVEWLLIGGLLGLIIMGTASVYSATMGSVSMTGKQVIWYLAGITAGGIFCLIPYHNLTRWALVAYWVTILLLIAVLVPGIGSSKSGARRWIEAGSFQFQPSEFAKLAFIFVQAQFLSRPLEELRSPGIFAKALGMTVLPFVLILKEPDLGSALVLLPVGLALMFVAGVPLKYLLRVVGGVGTLIALLLVDILFAPPNWQIKLEDYQRHRLLVYFDRDFAPREATPEQRKRARELQEQKSYQMRQALITVGTGGLMGKGWREGTQTALGYLPGGAAHNDFIFSVIAEENGFVGSVIVLTLYTMVLFSGIKIAEQARDRLGKLLAVGVVVLLFSHVFINIGMNIRLMPVTGIPLPLLSYGGSSVLCSLIAAGILQNVYLYRRSY
jgi:rod shape determining protein RodA